ncbi:MAG: hypothetical protein V1753_02555 [Pseudomonadota bacterium]
MNIKLCIALLTAFFVATGCATINGIEVIDTTQIGTEESIVVMQVVELYHNCPSIFLGETTISPKSERKVIKLEDESAASYYICRVLPPGKYTLSTDEYGYMPESSIGDDVGFLGGYEWLNKTSHSAQHGKKDIFCFDVPPGRLVDLGQLKINAREFSGASFFDRKYAEKTWTFQLAESFLGVEALEQQFPDIFKNFKDRVYKTEIKRCSALSSD